MVNWKSAALLVLLLGAFGVYLIQGGRSHPPAPRPSPGLLPCDSAGTLDLRITGADGAVVQVRRDSAGSDWTLVRPVLGPADPSVVSDLLTTATGLTATDTLKATTSGADLGLDPPQATVACTVVGGASYTLMLGGRNFDGSGYYARVSKSARVQVISAAAAEKFLKVLGQPPVRPNPTPSAGPSPSPST